MKIEELIKQTKQFKDTENLWTNDLKVKIDILFSKLDTLEKVAAGVENEITAYAKQFAKDKETFFAQMDTALVALKSSMAEQAIDSLTTGDPHKWLGGIQKARDDQYNVLKARAESVPKLIALATKNYGRIVKAVPQAVRDKSTFADGLKDLETRFKAFMIKLKAAEGAFKTAVATIEKNFPDIK